MCGLNIMPVMACGRCGRCQTVVVGGGGGVEGKNGRVSGGARQGKRAWGHQQLPGVTNRAGQGRA